MIIENKDSIYYKHIDGLRALAVTAVLLLHLDFSIFSGGYVGVDIFFVISGFLITGIIVNELKTTNKFSFLNFYTRRIRRIFPALFFTLLFSFILSIWLLNLAKFKVFGGSLAAAALSLSNVFFYSQAGYFDIYSKSNPLLHTWSLGIEEQFYIFWPILLFITFKFFRKYFLSITFFVFTTSLILNIHYQHKDLIGLYYLVHYRAFEFSIGACCVWIMGYQIKKNYVLELLCILGVLLIMYPIFRYNENTLFPSYNALMPTIGTGLIIYAGTAKYSGRVFRNRIVGFIGLISYSLYLIHWPLIVFFKTYKEDVFQLSTLSLKIKIALLLLSMIAATLMYYFIEQPFRRSISKDKNKQISIIMRALCITAIMTAAGMILYHSKGWLWRASDPVAAAKEKDIANYHKKNWGGAEFSGGYIYKGKTNAPSIVMMGDSHCGMLDEGVVKEIAKPYNITVFTVSGGGAGKYPSSSLLPELTELYANQYTNQTNLDHAAKEAYLEALSKLSESKNSILILSVNYSSQINYAGYLDSHKSLGINTDTMDKYDQYKPFVDALDRLREKIGDHKLVIIGDTPRGSKYKPVECIPQLKWFHGNNCAFQQAESTTNKGSMNVNKILKEYANQHRDVYFINPYDVFCEKGVCLNANKEGTPLYSDGSHLSKAGSIYIISHIKNTILNMIANKEPESNATG